ncbi:hypothetical protein [Flexibacterium corallicola]|uniref:hypothetical protein n=1 Tax=Flexibacterium corallicola TaxID=3037259 RepID=UPI00286F2C84|nr:hypothetical protein [Pseudovibrio sp. M1P-2-3]
MSTHGKQLFTDITLELYNGCAGSCTGCLLSVAERGQGFPLMSISMFEAVVNQIATYGKSIDLNYRIVLVFGDVPQLPLDALHKYIEIVQTAGLSIGMTMTLTSENYWDVYESKLVSIINTCPNIVFDITVDPIRLSRNKEYGNRLRKACRLAPKVHLQMLLSEALLSKLGPQDLGKELDMELEGRSVSLGFTPTIENMGRKNYGYSVDKAAGWATQFYNSTAAGSALFKDELRRFNSSGSYEQFIAQTYHVSSDGKVWPTAYTSFGDVILDYRNKAPALGDLKSTCLDQILKSPTVKRLGIQSYNKLLNSPFSCSECEHFNSCNFNGIGIVRRVYKDVESRLGSCYGPKAFL